MAFLEPRYVYEEPSEDEALLEMDWAVPWHAQIPPVTLTAGLLLAYLGYLFLLGDFDAEGLGMLKWAVSASALREGNFETIVRHMVAHGGPVHLFMNAAALIALGPALVARLGAVPLSWARFLTIFFLSGLAGCALFLAIHPYGSVPMLGASGAICGILGLLSRFQSGSDQLASLQSRKVWLTAKQFAKDNAFLFVMLTVPALLSGSSGGVAWETHLGGLLFGLIAGPFFVPRCPAQSEYTLSEEPSYLG